MRRLLRPAPVFLSVLRAQGSIAKYILGVLPFVSVDL